MTTKEMLDRVLGFIQELTQFHAELSQELPDLRVVVDNAHNYSDVKKTPAASCYSSRALRRLHTTTTLCKNRQFN